MRYLANAFSLQMVPDGADVEIRTIRTEDARDILNIENLDRGCEGLRILTARSVIGHADTAAVVSDILGITIKMNRENIKMEAGDELFVAQVQGGRLPEGAQALPEGFSIKFMVVGIRAAGSAKVNRELVGQLLRHIAGELDEEGRGPSEYQETAKILGLPGPK